MSSVGMREEDRMMFCEATRLRRHPQFSPLLERVIFFFFWLFVRSEPRVRLNTQLPFETSDIYAVTGYRVAMTHSTVVDHYELRSSGLKEDEGTVMSRLIGCFESWTSRCWERKREESWRGLVHGEKIKHLSFQISFSSFVSKKQRLKRKNLALAKRWGSRDILWFIIKDFILLATLQSC